MNQNKSKMVFFLVVLLAFFAPLAFAYTNKTGTITVTGSNVVLTIEPGAIVKFAPVTSILVQGSARVVADGNATHPIVFTSCKDQNSWAGEDTSGEAGCSGAPTGGDYNNALYITRSAGMTKSHSLSYLKVFDANRGIVLDLNIGSVHDSNFMFMPGRPTNASSGIYMALGSDINIFNNSFEHFGAGGSAQGIVNELNFCFGNIYNNQFSDM